MLQDYTFLTVGFFFLIAGLFFYYLPILDEREAANTYGGIVLRHPWEFHFNQIEIQFDLRGEQHYMIFNSWVPRINYTSYAILAVPYQGNIVLDSHGWKKIETTYEGKSYIYKNYNCSIENPCLAERDNVAFLFDEKIDSKQFYVHSINIPIGTYSVYSDEIPRSIHSKITNSTSLESNGFLSVQNKAKLMLGIPEDATEINPVPEGRLVINESLQYDIDQSFRSSIVFLWDIEDRATAFHLDYIIPNERVAFEDSRGMSYILLGAGVGFIITSAVQIFSKKKMDT